MWASLYLWHNKIKKRNDTRPGLFTMFIIGTTPFQKSCTQQLRFICDKTNLRKAANRRILKYFIKYIYTGHLVRYSMEIYQSCIRPLPISDGPSKTLILLWQPYFLVNKKCFCSLDWRFLLTLLKPLCQLNLSLAEIIHWLAPFKKIPLIQDDCHYSKIDFFS